MSEREARRTPTFFMMIIIVMLIMSLAALLLAVEAYVTQGKPEIIINMVLSVSAVILALYMLLQMRRRPLNLGFEALKVSTVIQCLKCGYTNMREFERGDYILKEAGFCPKCGGSLIIHSIFREVKEKD